MQCYSLDTSASENSRPLLLDLLLVVCMSTLDKAARPACHVESFHSEVYFARPCQRLIVTLLWALRSSSLSGPVNSDAMPNGEGLAEGVGAAGSSHLNGALLPAAPPQSASSPVSAQTQDPSPGVASHPPMTLEKSEGDSAEGTVHTADSLQSLRLSIPMQETELCKHINLCGVNSLSITPPSIDNLVLLWVVVVFAFLTRICILFVKPLFVYFSVCYLIKKRLLLEFEVASFLHPMII